MKLTEIKNQLSDLAVQCACLSVVYEKIKIYIEVKFQDDSLSMGDEFYSFQDFLEHIDNERELNFVFINFAVYDPFFYNETDKDCFRYGYLNILNQNQDDVFAIRCSYLDKNHFYEQKSISKEDLPCKLDFVINDINHYI